MKVETKVEIGKPPSEVYEFLMDEENLTLWIKNFVKLERLEGEEGEVGSTSRHVYNENGRTVEFIEEITAIKEGRLMQSIIRNKNMEIEIRNELFPVEDHSTQLVVTSDLRPLNLVFRILTFFSRKSIAKRQNEDLDRLKNAIEALGEDYEQAS